MLSGFVPRGGPTLMRTPNARHVATRRRLMVICAIVGLAIVSGLIGSLTGPQDSAPPAATIGPLSYLSAQ